MTSILRVENLSKSFGGFEALKDVSVSFEAGALTAVIGPNGAGKSTFFNLISGAFAPSNGRIFFEDKDITGLKPHEFAGRGIAKSFQITNLFPNLTAFENVRLGVQARSLHYQLWKNRASYVDINKEAEELLTTVGLSHRSKDLARALAHGEQRALEIAVALAASPRLLLLDEPTAGMSPEETIEMMALIRTLNKSRSIIIVEHKMKLIMDLASRIIVLHHGELLAVGTPKDIQNNEEVKRVYLGQRGSKAHA
jgi:branched-chain amino acid transport system ATP-binding protein